MKTRLPLGILVCLLFVAGGCPLNSSTPDESLAHAVIGITTTQGDAPLHVIVTGINSYSERGGIVRYHWDFGGEGSADTVAAEFTFTLPGRYPVTLTVVDVGGEQVMARIYVRVSGGAVTAVIKTDKQSGAAPLVVNFDGTESTAIDDTILDYYWDFGDSGTSRDSTPRHVFQSAGVYTVKLKVISAGGVEGYAETTITVGEGTGDGSLQFNGTQYANLPTGLTEAITAFSFEVWLNPDAEGGTVVTFGSPSVSIDAIPGAGVDIRSGGETLSVNAGVVAGQWQHLAVTYEQGEGATVYLGGAAVGTVSLDGEFTAPLLTLGAGYRGKLARAHFWSVARTPTQVAGDVNGTLTGYEEGLVGDWSLGAGEGQALGNGAEGGQNGTRGASEEDESADPAWSNDGP